MATDQFEHALRGAKDQNMNKLAAYLSANIKSTTIDNIIAEIPLVHKSDIAEYIEEGLEEANIDDTQWDELLSCEGVMRFRCAVHVLAQKAKSNDILERLLDLEPGSTNAKYVAQNSRCSNALKLRCIQLIRQEIDEMYGCGHSEKWSDYQVVWKR